MKPIQLVVAATIFLTACGGPKNLQQAETVQNIPVQKDSLFINGDDADWTEPLNVLDDKLGLTYGLSNDAENLYIRVKATNPSTIQRMLRAGFTVYINSHGVKEEAGAAAISFPTGNPPRNGGRPLNDRPELQQNSHLALNNVQDYSLFGFRKVKTPENFDLDKPNPEGIEVAVGLNPANALVYEAMVPLASFMAAPAGNLLSRRPASIEFVLDNIPGEGGSRGGGGGISIGGGLGFGSFGAGSGMGVSIGSGSLANIGGRRMGKPSRAWKEFVFAAPGAGG